MPPGSGFRVQGAGFGGWGLGFRVKSLGLRVQGSGLRVYERLVRPRLVIREPQRHRASRGLGLFEGLEYGVQGLGLRAWGSETAPAASPMRARARVWGLGFRMRFVGCGVWGLGFEV